MKTNTLLRIAFVFLISTSMYAQTPEKMSYQAVIRDGNDALVINQAIGMQISILLGSATGSSVYTETQSPTTNTNGLVSVEIGMGTTSDDFSAIDWTTGTYFIKTETDPSSGGGTNYTITGTSQLLSVPYALYAKTSGSSTPGPQGPQGDAGTQGTTGNDGATGQIGPQGADGVGIAQTISKSGNIVSLSNGGGNFIDDVNDNDNNPINELQMLSKTLDIVTLSNAGGSFSVDDADSDPLNELQDISLSGDDLSLSNGSTVDLSSIGFDGDYNSLINVPTNVSTFTNDAGYLITEVDGSLTNEIQTLSVSGSDLTISGTGGNTVVLPTTPWTVSGANIYKTNGQVGIGTSTPAAFSILHISDGEVADGLDNDMDGNADEIGEELVFTNTGRLGIGTTTPSERLSVTGTIESTTGGFKFPDGSVQSTAASAGGSSFGTTANVTSNSNGDIATDDFVFGSTQLADAPGTADDNRMYFDKSAGAFRIGTASGTQWNNPGQFSFATGRDNIASGYGSFVGGLDNIASTSGSTISGGSENVASGNVNTIGGGFKNITSNDYSTVGGGILNKATGYRSTVGGGSDNNASSNYTTVSGGYLNTASGQYSTVGGGWTVNAQSYGEFAVGYHSKNAASPTAGTIVATDRLITVGNGVDFSNRSNALILLKNGNLGLGVDIPTEKLEVNGSVKITDGTEGVGKVLTSDANGKASWTNSTGLSGTIITYAGSNVPAGYLVCDGSAVSRVTYANLFAALGTAWGIGDGTTTFNLPDLRGRFLRGVDNGAGRDPNSGTRAATNGGNSGDNVGSVQSDEFKSHTHNLTDLGTVTLMDAGSSLGTYIQSGSKTSTATGGAETRPINVYVSYLILY